MSRNYFTAKNLARKHELQKANEKLNYLPSRQIFSRADFLNTMVFEVVTSIVFFSDFL